MYYDKDDAIFCQLSEHYHSSPASSSSESSESATNQKEIYFNVGMSTMSLNESLARAGCESDERSSSCPPRMELETKYDLKSPCEGNRFSLRLEPFLQTGAVQTGEETTHGLVRINSFNHRVL